MDKKPEFGELMFRQMRESFRNRQKASGVLRELAHQTLKKWPAGTSASQHQVRLVEGPLDGAVVVVSSGDPLLIGFIASIDFQDLGIGREWHIATNPAQASMASRWVAYMQAGADTVYRFVDSGAI